MHDTAAFAVQDFDFKIGTSGKPAASGESTQEYRYNISVMLVRASKKNKHANKQTYKKPLV